MEIEGEGEGEGDRGESREGLGEILSGLQAGRYLG